MPCTTLSVALLNDTRSLVDSFRGAFSQHVHERQEANETASLSMVSEDIFDRIEFSPPKIFSFHWRRTENSTFARENRRANLV